ncbi:MAG: PAS domain S-box protein [Bdellovibrionales bacterium]|nr:PAS domain S-box protein [Bdellovibrionales bacterium]
MLKSLNKIELDRVLESIEGSCIIDVTDGDGRILFVNKPFCEASGYEKKFLVGQTHQLINSGFHSKEFFAELWETLLSGQTWTGEIRNRNKSGDNYWVQSTITPFLGETREETRFVAIHKLITEAKQAQHYLEKTQKEFREINFALNQTAIVAVTDVSGVITYVNDKFCEISKYRKDELIGKTHQVLNSGHHSREFFKNLWKTISRGSIWKGEVKNRAKDGSFYWVDTTIIPNLDNSGHPIRYTAIRKEVTERKLAEARLEQERAKAAYSEKMASLGELSAGIAHELGNPLGAMRGRLEMLEMQLGDTSTELDREAAAQIVQKTISLVDRMSKIIRGLRSYARDGSNDPLTPTSLNQLLSDILDISNSKFRKVGLEDIRLDLDEEVTTLCREAEIGQVIVNLVNNACDAIKDQSEKWLSIAIKSQNDKVVVRVTDSGPGISAEDRQKIFTPYFTTKPVGVGTGLGLAISSNIIAAHQGQLKLCEDSEHTCFEFSLPTVPTAAEKNL